MNRNEIFCESQKKKKNSASVFLMSFSEQWKKKSKQTWFNLEEIERHVQDLKQEMKDLTEDNDKISSPISSPSRDTKEEERVGEA